MAVAEKFTSADLALMPDNGKRYEIIEGELYVSRQPGFEHQYTCGRLFRFLDEWNDGGGLGVVVNAPGVIFAEDDDVAPDLIWISKERFSNALDQARHFRVAPDLVVEGLSPGKLNEERDREIKLKLYSRRGVREYWIVNWMLCLVEVYRRDNAALKLAATLYSEDRVQTSLLPGFSCKVSRLFFPPQS